MIISKDYSQLAKQKSQALPLEFCRNSKAEFKISILKKREGSGVLLLEVVGMGKLEAD